ncbi:MAG: hypothetical protein WC279_11430 [Sulfurimonas sp.]|uniref:hypothetical protein n=1 Tax=Sulfurimonas sp. TaxID=2022749 RepID=UPI00356452A0
MLAPNFTAGEFLKHCPVTVMDTVIQMQKFRDMKKEPVTVTGAGLAGNILITSGKTASGASVRIRSEVNPANLPVYGPKAELSPAALTRLYSVNGYKNFNTAEKLILAALCQNGFKEGNNNDTPFGKDMGLNNTPWCAVYYHWCLKVACALEGKEPPVPFKPEYSNSRYTLERAPVMVTDPSLFQPGSAVVWKRKGSSTAGHTAILTLNDPVRRHMFFIEGNMSDAVRIIKRDYDNLTSGDLILYGAAQYLPDTAAGIITNGKAEKVTNESYT